MSSFKSPLSLASSVDGSSSDRWVCLTTLPVRFTSLLGQCSLEKQQLSFVESNLRATMAGTLLTLLISNVAIIKSSKDTRYAVDSVVTHDGTKFPCWALPDLLSFRQKFGDEAYAKNLIVSCGLTLYNWMWIGIDEAQFFGDLYDFCCKVADHDGKTVIVAGLDRDYLRFFLQINSFFFSFP
ncbi:hypothetical protein HYC85_011666 [Camellia sinensis]|uniref:Thymidine kinase n=1 Tax=Camellia sinensis TaxID=4442 RepID=A0A7J7H9N4_CAMSI|nr:hypothetical protein HYC85_011666 [Camellia sinensis]